MAALLSEKLVLLRAKISVCNKNTKRVETTEEHREKFKLLCVQKVVTNFM